MMQIIGRKLARYSPWDRVWSRDIFKKICYYKRSDKIVFLRRRPTPKMSRLSTSPSLASLLLLVLSLPALVSAQQIYRDSDPYAYQGCITETTDVVNSSNPRALPGSVRVDEHAMTVPMCLDFCASGGDTTTRRYRYAGLQFSRYVFSLPPINQLECWCAQLVSDLSRTVDDRQCNLTCAGDTDMVCGGNMRISLYMIEDRSGGGAVAWPPLLVALGGAVAISMESEQWRFCLHFFLFFRVSFLPRYPACALVARRQTLTFSAVRHPYHNGITITNSSKIAS
ncbi:hypothetical protein ACRALDRAFT_1093670 [Sodiomyces alcalophilus JCM 7366]|uniref:uncharacterized protein n=1 Tax=Sodiomyces alcalophilus JCM 7366 TaxID=591952 RepID=UPI0039B3BD74